MNLKKTLWHPAFVAKLWLAPAFILALMLAVMAGGFITMQHQQSTVRELVEIRHPNLLLSINLEQQLKEIHAASYQFLAWTSASYPATRIDGLANSIRQSLPKAQTLAKGMGERPGLSPKERDIANKLIQSVQQFTANIPTVLELAQVDQSVATTLMMKAEVSFATLRLEMDAFRVAQATAMATAEKQAADSFIHAITQGSIVAALSILLGTFVTLSVRKALQEKLRAEAEVALAHAATLKAEQDRVESLRLSERLLELRVEQRTLELSHTIEHLKLTQAELVQAEKLASLGALVAGVAHELNTPIGNALMMSTTLEEASKQFDALIETGPLRRSDLSHYAQNSKSMAEMVTRSCQRAATLITIFKQIAVDQASEQRRSFDLKTLIQDNIATLKPSLNQTNWNIETTIPPDIRCDSYPGPLGQVIIHLIQNAGTHAFETVQNGTLSISARLTEEQIQLTFTDNGKGMDAHVLTHIFDPFYTTRLGQGGNGLGMAISRNIVEGVLGGSIHATSTLGQGSCFILDFPAHAPESCSLSCAHQSSPS